MNLKPHTNNSGLQPAEMLCATVAHLNKFKILSFVSLCLCAFVPFLFLTLFLPISAFSLSKDAIKFYEAGNKNFRDGTYETAIENYQKAIKIEPKYFWPNFNLGRAYMQINEYTLAIDAFERAKAIKIKHEGIEMLLSECYSNIQAKQKSNHEKNAAAEADEKNISEHTGVIIDAKGLGIKPSMCPKIEDEQGREIYTGAEAPVDYVISVGIVGYSKNIESAKKMRRVSPTPLVVKAIKGQGIVKTEVVISAEDSDKLLEINKTAKFFERCAVVFVID